MSKEKLPEMDIQQITYHCTYCQNRVEAALILTPSKKRVVYICADCLIKAFDKVLREE